MAYQRNNTYQYETSPRKLQPEYEPIQKKQSKEYKKNEQTKKISKSVKNRTKAKQPPKIKIKV